MRLCPTTISPAQKKANAPVSRQRDSIAVLRDAIENNFSRWDSAKTENSVEIFQLLCADRLHFKERYPHPLVNFIG